ncbi:MAG: DUF6268 family outer membrane beta-barrel protein [Bacteroidota bacterium]
MKNLCKIGCFIFLLLCCNNMQAQDMERFSVESTFYPSQAIEESDIEGEVGFWEWNGQLTLPQPIKGKKMILIHRFSYSNLSVDLNATTNNVDTEFMKNYHTISYSLGLVKIFNPKWQLLVNVSPTLASDFGESLSGDDFIFQASSMAIYNKSKKFKYGFGLAYTTQFGIPIPIPLGMFKYTKPKMTLDILLPNRISVMWNTHKRINFGLAATLNGGFFNNTGENPVVNSLIDEAGYSRLNLGPQVSFQLKEAIKLNLSGGMAAGRRLEFTDEFGDTIDRTPESGPFINLGVSFKPGGSKTEAVPRLGF